MNYLDSNELSALSLGATLLGSGGGGDPTILYGHLHYLLEKNGPIKIIQPEYLSPDALLIPIALIGAPLISLERIPNSTLFLALFKEIKKQHPDRECVLMPAEIGGCNALTPFMLAAQAALPVLDADLIGRAFPQLNMCKPAILGKDKQVSYLASPYGDCLTIKTDSIAALESKVRDATLHFGSSAVLATFLFNAQEQDEYIIPGSLTRALNLGRLLEKHAKDLSSLSTATQAKKIGSGLITEVSHSIEGGFLLGYATIKTTRGELQVFYQNEYLLVKTRDGNNLAESPDLIALLESHSGLPLTSETLRFGLKVEIFSLAAPSFWQEPYARSQVDLQAFGLTTDKGLAYV